MKVIVIRQPWAWLIVHGFKDIENRSWATRYRGMLLIQASAGRPTKRSLEEARVFARKRGVELPEDFERGGIVGMVRWGIVSLEAGVSGLRGRSGGCSRGQRSSRSCHSRGGWGCLIRL
jgi:hypothetical protein